MYPAGNFNTTYCFVGSGWYLHVTRRTTIQQAVAVVDATEGPRGRGPAAGLVIMRVEMARGAAENRVRLSAGAGGDPAVQRRAEAAAAVVLIRPRFSRGTADAVQAQRVRVALRQNKT